MSSIPITSKSEPIFDDIELTRQEIKWLAEIGFIVPQLGKPKIALILFHALSLCQPEADFPYVGKAHAYLGTGNYKEAIEILRNGLSQHPESADIKCLLATALKFVGRNAEADFLLKSVLENHTHSSDPIYHLAKELSKPNVIQPQKRDYSRK